MHHYMATKWKSCYLQRNLPHLLALLFLMQVSPAVATYCYPSKSIHHNGDSNAQNGPTSCPPHSRFFQFVMDTSKIKSSFISKENSYICLHKVFLKKKDNLTEILLNIKTINRTIWVQIFKLLNQQSCFVIFFFLNDWSQYLVKWIFQYTPSGNKNHLHCFGK